MKKIPINTLIIGAVVILALGVGSYFLIKNKKESSETTQRNTTETGTDATNTKGDNVPDSNGANETVTNIPVTPTSIGTLPALSDVSLTVYLNAQATTSQDGKTTLPAGSIMPSFYLPAGIYSVQKLVGSAWQNVATNINYPGHGGLSAPVIAPAEDNVSYRVIKIENGNPKSVSKTFVVKRADISGGYKTYN